ncbi:MAG: prevent-host-death family protein [Pseudarthrobacter sp.]|nr:prevent-host-death family protein [Pseudarthrobacter sp.]
MRTVPLSEAKDKLSALVEEADKTHEIIQITRHGHPSAVLMSAADLESLQETIHWLSQPGIREDLHHPTAAPVGDFLALAAPLPAGTAALGCVPSRRAAARRPRI